MPVDPVTSRWDGRIGTATTAGRCRPAAPTLSISRCSSSGRASTRRHWWEATSTSSLGKRATVRFSGFPQHLSPYTHLPFTPYIKITCAVESDGNRLFGGWCCSTILFLATLNISLVEVLVELCSEKMRYRRIGNGLLPLWVVWCPKIDWRQLRPSINWFRKGSCVDKTSRFKVGTLVDLYNNMRFTLRMQMIKKWNTWKKSEFKRLRSNFLFSTIGLQDR